MRVRARWIVPSVGWRIYQQLKIDPSHHQDDNDNKTKEDDDDDEDEDAVEEGHAVGSVTIKCPTRLHHPTSHPGPFQK